VAPGDQHRILAVEPDPGADRGLAVDVVVLVDEHAVFAAQAPPEGVELLPQVGIAVEPRIAGKSTLPGLDRLLLRVVAEPGRDDRLRIRHQRLGMAGDLGPCHREAHVGKEPAGAALPDLLLGLNVRCGRSGADDVDPELLCELRELGDSHTRIVPSCGH